METRFKSLNVIPCEKALIKIFGWDVWIFRFKSRKVKDQRGAFFKLTVYKSVGENGHFSIRKGPKISCKVEEVVAKAKYIRETTTQLNQND